MKKDALPIPMYLCNREIKFDVFLDSAHKFGADYIATGHYARVDQITNDKGTFTRLLAGKDDNKDQSYFLCQLSQEQLKNVLFPLGRNRKTRSQAHCCRAGPGFCHQKDSQGICFVGKVDLPTFLQQKLAPKKGKVIEIDDDDPFLLALS
jgi:tRNA-uridine 2-sulfurtransferase